MQGDLPSNIIVHSVLQEDDGSFDVSDDPAMRLLWEAEERHFWHVARNEFILQHVLALGVCPPAHIVELGCGGGCVTAHLAKYGFNVVGVDGQLRRVVDAAKRAPQSTFYVFDLTKGTNDLPSDNDMVGLFDVIEHLDAPAQALASALELVKPGGFLVGTVPALMSLWSDQDAKAGHRMRYSAKTLTALLSGIRGARLKSVEYFNRLLIAPIWLARRNKTGPASAGLVVPPEPINSVVREMLRAEYKLSSYLNKTPIAGASLWFSVQKL